MFRDRTRQTFSGLQNMAKATQLAKGLTVFKENMDTISKVDNKLARALALDHAAFSLRLTTSNVLGTLDGLAKFQDHNRSHPKLCPLLPSQNIQEPDYLGCYLNRQKKRDERYPKFELVKTSKPQQFRRSKAVKSKSKHLYTFYGTSNPKEKHNRLIERQLSREDYSQGLYQLSSTIKPEKIDKGFIEEVLPKPVRNVIMRRNLEQVFVTRNQNPQSLTLYPLKQRVRTNLGTTIQASIQSAPAQHPTFTQDYSEQGFGDQVVPFTEVHQGSSLQILNYKLVMTQAARMLKSENASVWSELAHVISGIEDLLRRHGVSASRIKTRELLALQGLSRRIPDCLLLQCLSNPHLLLAPSSLDSAAKLIQRCWRRHRQSLN